MNFLCDSRGRFFFSSSPTNDTKSSPTSLVINEAVPAFHCQKRRSVGPCLSPDARVWPGRCVDRGIRWAYVRRKLIAIPLRESMVPYTRGQCRWEDALWWSGQERPHESCSLQFRHTNANVRTRAPVCPDSHNRSVIGGGPTPRSGRSFATFFFCGTLLAYRLLHIFAIDVNGVALAFPVRQRTREIGARMRVGPPVDMLMLIFPKA